MVRARPLPDEPGLARNDEPFWGLDDRRRTQQNKTTKETPKKSPHPEISPPMLADSFVVSQMIEGRSSRHCSPQPYANFVTSWGLKT